MSRKIKAGIVGGAGYTGGELLRLLLLHPQVEIAFVNSTSNAGRKVWEVHEGLLGDTNLTFTDQLPLDEIDVLFLCSGHGESSRFLESHDIPEKLHIVDLAQDFRNETNGFVYGLPAVNREKIAEAKRIANPGCFATAIQLSLAPLAEASLLHGDVNITALTGSTGAGVKPGATTHFSWRDNNLSIYKPFTHQHLAEIERTLKKLQPDFSSELFFVPVRGDFPRGIFSMVTVNCDEPMDRLINLYRKFYRYDPFVTVIEGEPDLKQVVNTNKAIVGLRRHSGKLLITCVIDNLLKGASGQAVQNMNLMFGLEETEGLRLKASAF